MGLIRYPVFFVIDLPTRKLDIAGIDPIPDGLWMEQVARNPIDDFTCLLREKRRDPSIEYWNTTGSPENEISPDRTC